LGANDRVRVGLIGAGGRGSAVGTGFAEHKESELAYVCDLHTGRLDSRAKYFATKQNGKRPGMTKHMGQLFDDNNIDAVIVATPDQWHCLATIRACQAGKDVYVEKPPSHNVWEGRKMIQAARKYKRVVQVGTQNRSAPYNIKAREYVQSGKLGDIHLVKVYNLKAGGSFKLPPDGKAPAGFDWKAWLGPAPQRPYNSRIFHGGWHKLWDFSGGDMSDCGIHQTDLAMMLLGDPAMPTAVSATGGRMHYKGDDAEVPDTMVSTFDFDGMIMVHELTNYPSYMKKISGEIRGSDKLPYWPQCATRIEFYGSKQQLIMGRHGGGWQAVVGDGKVMAQEFGRPGDEPHRQNFIDCIKNRKQANSDPSWVQRSQP
jgi:predicted dehydrogenase